VDCVLDGGAADVGIESTIVDLSGATPALLRPGWITAGEIEAALGTRLTAPAADAPRAPGTLAAHYAPQTPLMLMEGDIALKLAASLSRQGRHVAMLALSARRPLLQGLTWIAAPRDAPGYAHALYASLRRLDESGCDTLIVEKPPQGPEWTAVNDRLARAATGSSVLDET
jgi:L-threonylcarbamoyladenylate synthase